MVLPVPSRWLRMTSLKNFRVQVTETVVYEPHSLLNIFKNSNERQVPKASTCIAITNPMNSGI